MAAVFIPSLGTTDVILRGEARLTLLNRLYKILRKLLQLLMLNKYKLERWFTKQIGLRYYDSCPRRNLCYYLYPVLCIYTQYKH